MERDYRKDYEELISKLKTILDSQTNETISIDSIKEVIPELSESKDNIENRLINAIKSSAQLENCLQKHGFKIKEILNWLEKQIERKSDVRYRYLEELLVADDFYQMAMNDAMVEEAKDKATSALIGLEISKLLGLEKQVEQIKDNKEEIIYLKKNMDYSSEIIGFLKNYIKAYGCTAMNSWVNWLEEQCHGGKKWIYEDTYIKDKEQTFQDGIDEVLENPQKYGLEKQQDNNEDSNVLRRFSFYSYKDEPNILYLSGLYVNKECRNKGIGTKILEVADEVANSLNCHTIRLKTKKDSNAERLYRALGYNSLATEERDEIWLEKQCEKRYTWSEEDEKMRNVVIDACKYMVENFENSTKQYEDAINWLESIKPNHWKPSEEQLRAIINSAQGLYQCKEKEVLLDLYEQLKKL